MRWSSSCAKRGDVRSARLMCQSGHVGRILTHLIDCRIKCITIMKFYTKTKVIRISETQLKTLQKMKEYNIDVGKFIRDAISEKIKREYQDLIPKVKKEKQPF